jgi:hypothetical protein
MGGVFSRANVFSPEQPQNLHFVRPPMVQRAAAAAFAMRQKQLALQQHQLSQQPIPGATSPKPVVTTAAAQQQTLVSQQIQSPQNM